MRSSIIYTLIPCMLLFYAGCKKYDNYAAPDAGVYGKVIDAGTGGGIETKQPGGGDIRFLQNNKTKYPSPQPIDISIKADGSYSATQFFADNYKAFPLNGPFIYAGDSVGVVLNHNQKTQLDFKVVPFYRITAAVADSTFSYTVNRAPENNSKLIELIFMVSKDPVVNEAVSSNVAGPGTYYANLWKVPTDGTPDASIVDKPQTFTFHWADTRLPKGEYYFRMGARAANSPNSTYNYSPVVKATVH
ncbi:DUF3823 domain-containing protein [Mucilaginibacter sp. CAU 1740]|uniref:DUF3823 domain-containing protein n=1 Tax=Mucilaginibacter sp. CAU 1740 TaxID=3140365 RepID=UPI00325C278D